MNMQPVKDWHDVRRIADQLKKCQENFNHQEKADKLINKGHLDDCKGLIRNACGYVKKMHIHEYVDKWTESYTSRFSVYLIVFDKWSLPVKFCCCVLWYDETYKHHLSVDSLPAGKDVPILLGSCNFCYFKHPQTEKKLSLGVSHPSPPALTHIYAAHLIARALKPHLKDDNETSQQYTQVLKDEGTFVI